MEPPLTALVTGSTQGIGYAIADTLLGDGCHVVVHGRTPARCIRVREKLNAHGHVAGDLTTPDGVEAVAKVAEGADILVLNAGNLPTSNARTLLDTPTEDYEHDMALHVWSSIRLIQAAMPGMLARGWGRIITIGTEASTWTRNKVGVAPYILSKHAAVMVARLADEEAHRTNVTSNAVIVGPTRTEGVEAVVKAALPLFSVTDAITRLYPTLPAGRAAHPNEVADVVALLVSRRSNAIRGQAIRAEFGAIPTV